MISTDFSISKPNFSINFTSKNIMGFCSFFCWVEEVLVRYAEINSVQNFIRNKIQKKFIISVMEEKALEFIQGTISNSLTRRIL